MQFKTISIMELEGIVYAILPVASGSSPRGNWSRQEIVVEFKSGEFNRKLCLSFWGDKTAQLTNVAVGERIKAFFDLESREFNGKWFTTAQAWKLERNINVASQTAPSMEDIGPGAAYDDEIPF